MALLAQARQLRQVTQLRQMLERWQPDRRRAARVVAASGLFDPAWYRATYPDLGPGDPLADYLHRPAASGRSPGPLFDAARYRRDHPDVAAAGVDPLVHFLTAPAREGRRAWTATLPSSADRPLLSVPYQARPPSGQRVAVMVHAFYPDTFEELCRALGNLRVPFTLLVSVPTAEGRDAALAAIDRARLDASHDVRVCPNRGRNFGPLVTTFAGAIAEHDVLLHLHTKRSLYTGAEQRDWRSGLVGSLVGSPAVASISLELLAARPDVGLVYPVTSPHLAYWAHHWLANAPAAPALFERLGVSEFPRRGYFPYPVGGMFWARVDAIRPLLEARIGVDEFVEEAGQTDGTLAHVIERCFVPMARAGGFGFVEAAPDRGVFRDGWSSLNLEQYLGCSDEGLRRAVEAADVVSFDVFDTVLTRLSTEPDSVQRAAGEWLRLRHPQASGFYEGRKQAETAARVAKGWAGDVTLSEIYDAWERDEVWTDELLGAARACELELEWRTSLPRRPVAEAVRHAHRHGARVVAVSDTYFEREHVEHLLDEAGVAEEFDELYLSSDLGARKDRGDLWDQLLTRPEFGRAQWLHVGDNERSDVQAASDRGIAIYHCMNPTTLAGLRGLGAAVDRPGHPWGNDLLLGPVVARLANDPFPDNGRFTPVDVPRPEDLGTTVFGPVVMAFLWWLVNHPALEDVDHLFFCAREGYPLQTAWEYVRKYALPDLPESTYLLTSRRTVLSAAQAGGFDPDAIMEGSDFDGTLGGLLSSRLGVDLRLPPGTTERAIRLPADRAAVGELLEAHRGDIERHGATERTGLLEYLAQVGLAASSAPAVVDIGYSGTIQKHLQTVLGRGVAGFYMGTLAQADQVRAGGGEAYGCFIERHPAWTATSPFLPISLVLEAFLTAPHGQVERVGVGTDGRPEATFRADHRTTAELAVLADLRSGALRYCEEVLTAYGASFFRAPLDPSSSLALVEALASGAIRSPRAAAALIVDDDFCGVARRAAPIA